MAKTKETPQKKTKRQEFAEHKAAALSSLDLASLDGALYFHAVNDPARYYRLTATDPGVYGLINAATGEDLTPTEQDELLKGLTRHVLDPRFVGDFVVSEAPVEYVLFKNGIFDLNKGEFVGNDPELIEQLSLHHQIFTSYIPHEYDPSRITDRDRETVDKFFASLSAGDADVEAILYEIIGYCFYRSCKFRKALLLKGAKGCGKSTYLDMVRNILGTDHTTALSLKELSDKFSTIELVGKLANIGDELDKEYISTSGKFKSIVSGMSITGQKKYGDPISFAPHAKMLFAMNGDLRMDDPGNAVADRLIQIPFPASLDKSEIDTNLPYKLKQPGAIQYVIEKSLKAFINVLDRDGFTESSIAEKTRIEWEQYNNPILAWLTEYKAEGNSVADKVDGDLLFNEFNPWVKDQQMRVSYSLPNFRQELLALMPELEVGTRTRYREVMDDYGTKERWGYKLVVRKDKTKASTDEESSKAPKAPTASTASTASTDRDTDRDTDTETDGGSEFCENVSKDPTFVPGFVSPHSYYMSMLNDGLDDDDGDIPF